MVPYIGWKKSPLQNPISSRLLPHAVSLSEISPPCQQKSMIGPPSEHTGATAAAFKFLCSYGGKILPRYPDGKLRYVGGHTRVLAVDRSISFSELLLKLGDLCGTAVSLRCQLPAEDLDALVSVKSDQDLVYLMEEYDHAVSSCPSLKIRAFLSASRSGHQQRASPPLSDSSSPKSLSPTSSSSSSSCSFSSSSAVRSTSSSRFPAPVAKATDRCIHLPLAPVKAFPVRSARKVAQYAYNHRGNPSNVCLVHSSNIWQ